MLTPWKESYDQPRQHIKKQRHYFANRGLSAAAAKSPQSCPTLCNPIDSSSPCFPIPGSGRSLEKGIAIHFSILAWRILWTEEPGGLHGVGLQRVAKSQTRLSG